MNIGIYEKLQCSALVPAYGKQRENCYSLERIVVCKFWIKDGTSRKNVLYFTTPAIKHQIIVSNQNKSTNSLLTFVLKIFDTDSNFILLLPLKKTKNIKQNSSNKK